MKLYRNFSAKSPLLKKGGKHKSFKDAKQQRIAGKRIAKHYQ